MLANIERHTGATIPGSRKNAFCETCLYPNVCHGLVVTKVRMPPLGLELLSQLPLILARTNHSPEVLGPSVEARWHEAAPEIRLPTYSSYRNRSSFPLLRTCRATNAETRVGGPSSHASSHSRFGPGVPGCPR